MLTDFKAGEIDNFIILSTDNDFADLIKQIANDDKKPIIFAVAGGVSSEPATSAYCFGEKGVAL